MNIGDASQVPGYIHCSIRARGKDHSLLRGVIVVP